MRREDLEAMTVAELKILLSNLALPVSGKKADLIDRILQNQDPKIVEEDPSSSEVDGRENRETAHEEIESVVSHMIEGRDLNQESEITLQSMVLIGVVVCALALVVLSL